MAKYTVELGRLLESGFDIGLDKYPIFDENYRRNLNNKIIEHFYFREIGFETAELFKRYLNRTMNEIMPYYNQLYKSELISFNPLYNVDKWETAETDFDGKQNYKGKAVLDSDFTSHSNTDNTDNFTGSVNTVSNSSANAESKTNESQNEKHVKSDTPQGLLAIGNIESELYASQAEFDYTIKNSTTNTNENASTETTQTTNNTDLFNSVSDSTANTDSVTDSTADTITDNFTKYARHVSGKSEGETYSEMLLKFRETFLNIDMMIINDLKTCFMMIY